MQIEKLGNESKFLIMYMHVSITIIIHNIETTSKECCIMTIKHVKNTCHPLVHMIH